AAIATFELMGKQLLYKLGQDPGLKEVRKEAILQDKFLKESRGRRLIRAIYDEGRVYLPKGGHSSGILGSMVGCNCLIDIKPGTPKLDKGEKVEVVLL
ncbi:MAG: molybdopterin molybdenumtransferase MoeA, partial [Intestinibacter sp.]